MFYQDFRRSSSRSWKHIEWCIETRPIATPMGWSPAKSFPGSSTVNFSPGCITYVAMQNSTVDDLYCKSQRFIRTFETVLGFPKAWSSERTA